MTEQEAIDEIQKIIDDSWEFSSISAELGSGDGDINVEEAAKALYDAGYRKIMTDKELNSKLDEEECDVVDDYTIGFATYLMQKRSDEVDRLQSEIKRLKKENAYLLKACEEKFTFNTTQNKKYSVFNTVRKVFADEVKAKLLAIFGKTICSDLDTEDITDIIDELLKEYE